MIKIHKHSQRGFTIIELMIATVVVSTLLITVTYVMIGLQNLYDKGLNEQRAQDNTRTIIDQIALEIQTTGQAIVAQPSVLTDTVTINSTSYSYNINAVCIGSVRYLYVINLEVGVQTKHALWRDSADSGNSCVLSPINKSIIDIINKTPSDNGEELIPSNARLTDFEVLQPTATDSNYTIKVSVAYGTDDLFNPAFPSATPNYDISCKGGIGDQFCATAKLTTGVGQRDTASGP
jgi:prepilin-type N-terminal cleavage/methylation domain-containing protein